MCITRTELCPFSRKDGSLISLYCTLLYFVWVDTRVRLHVSSFSYTHSIDRVLAPFFPTFRRRLHSKGLTSSRAPRRSLYAPFLKHLPVLVAPLTLRSSSEFQTSSPRVARQVEANSYPNSHLSLQGSQRLYSVSLSASWSAVEVRGELREDGLDPQPLPCSAPSAC